MAIEKIDYDSEDTNFIVKALNAAPYAAGTYKKGQLLGRVDSTGVFGAYDSSKNTGVEVVRAVCPDDFTAAAGQKHHVLRGEFSRKGVTEVMASLDSPVTVDDALIGMCFDAGIILN
jgi:hypothetical protein